MKLNELNQVDYTATQSSKNSNTLSSIFAPRLPNSETQTIHLKNPREQTTRLPSYPPCFLKTREERRHWCRYGINSGQSRWSANLTSPASEPNVASSWRTTGHGTWNAERGKGACAYYFFRLTVARTARAAALCCFLDRLGTRELLLGGGRSATFRFLFFFLFFFSSVVDAPRYRTPFYARWMEQVKRPLQLSDSCRRCPIYIRDEPLCSTRVCVCVRTLTPVYTRDTHTHTCTHVYQTNRTNGRRNAFSVLVHVQRARAYNAWRTRRRDR